MSAVQSRSHIMDPARRSPMLVCGLPTQLGYLGLGVSDLDTWTTYATNILGMEALPAEDDGSVLLRMDEHHHRFILTEDTRDDLVLIGWEVANEQNLTALTQRLDAAGIAYRQGSDAVLNRRRVINLIEFEDPNGITTEAYCGPLVNRAVPFNSPRRISGFLAGEQGLGHITMTVKSLADNLHFYRDVLGFRMSDWIRPQPERGAESNMNLAFLHCNQRHHSLAFWQGEMPKRLHHFMVQANDLDDVGATYYLCQQNDIAIDLSLGRHTNDQMLSFYMKSPSDFDVEFGWGAIEVDDNNWTVQLHTNGSSWGHLPVEPH